jgi:tetratricopeptide (TPR) repeat protein
MKYRIKFSAHYLIPVTLFLAGGGSIVFGISPLGGSILIILSILTGLLSYYYSLNQNDRSKYFMEGLAQLLAKNQLGNVYIESLKAEIREKGYSRNTKLLCEKALSLNPKDRQALEYFTAISSLEISRIRWIGAFTKKRYERILTSKIATIRKLTIEAIKLFPMSHVFHDVLGILFDAEAKHGKARKEFMLSGKLRSDANWEWEIAVSWGLSRNYSKALEAMERARAKGATVGLFSLYYGRTLHAVGKCDTAEKELQKARKEYRRLPELLDALCELYFDQGKFLLASKFSLMAGLSLIGISWFAAIVYFRNALTALFLSVACFVSKKLWLIVKWIPLLRSIQLRLLPPDQPEITLGRRLTAMGHFKLAEQHFRTACKIEPTSASNFGNLAISLFKQGKIKEAIEANAIALNMEPQNKEFKHNKERFEKGKIQDGRIIGWNARQGKYEELRK